MRFQVSSVMDAIEARLTTDVTGAQAVIDLGQVVRFVDLDGSRPVNLVRIGMAVDALSRYLVDDGAMLYGVAGRDLLSDQALTSKERMVLGRWCDDGLIEVVSEMTDRIAEVADLTGLPVLATDPPAAVERYPWWSDGSPRVLRLVPRNGVAALTPMDGVAVIEDASNKPVVGSAQVTAGGLVNGQQVELPLQAEVLTGRAAASLSHTRIARRRIMPGEPAQESAALLAKVWRCDGFDCPAFGDRRTQGQPVPRLRDGVPVCPRHGEPIVEVGPRLAAFPVSIVVDDLPRRRLVVRADEPVQIGRAVDDPKVVSVADWLHQAAAAWVSPVHLQLEANQEGLIVTDLSENGTVVWQRNGPDDQGATRSLWRSAYSLGEWDTVELYTGIELARGDRRSAMLVGRDEPSSVLVDAPTAAHRQLKIS